MNELSFLNEELASEYKASDATLKAVLPGGKVVHISDNVSPFKFLDTCPLLYHTFEYNSQGRLQASIEVPSENAVISLVRYCYTGSYLANEPDGNISLLLQHAETYKIAEVFDVPELQIMAHGNFSCQIEYACCLPKPPKDLLDTIRFVYRYFSSDKGRREHNLVDTLLNYCVAVYLYHKLGESLDFLTAVHEIPAFRQDLCRTNIARNFEDDCAAEIIRLPYSTVAESSRPPTTLSSRDLPSEMFYDKSQEPVSAKANTSPVILSLRRRTLSPKPRLPKIPDLSEHSVSPFALTAALTAALEKYNKEMNTESEPGAETVRKSKRARIGETKTRTLGRNSLPESLASGIYGRNEDSSVTMKAEFSTTSDEEAYWQGTFGQSEMRSSKAITEGTSQSVRRLFFECGSRSIRPEPKSSLSPAILDISMATVLPHRSRHPEPIPDASVMTDTVSEDDGFALVHHSQAIETSTLHSPMSSPELVAAVSVAQATVDETADGNDDWTLL